MSSSTSVIRIKGLNFYLSTPSLSKRRTPQSPPRDPPPAPPEDPWNVIDRRNDDVLQPIRTRNEKKSSTRLSIYSPPKVTKNFHLNSFHHYRTRRRSSDHTVMNPAAYLNKYANKPTTLTQSQTDSTFLFGNSIVKSNKAEVLLAFEQQMLHGNDESTVYVNKHGVQITEDGPFWPDSFRILHPTPRLATRTIGLKQFYLPPANPRQTLSFLLSTGTFFRPLPRRSAPSSDFRQPTGPLQVFRSVQTSDRRFRHGENRSTTDDQIVRRRTFLSPTDLRVAIRRGKPSSSQTRVRRISLLSRLVMPRSLLEANSNTNSSFDRIFTPDGTRNGIAFACKT